MAKDTLLASSGLVILTLMVVASMLPVSGIHASAIGVQYNYTLTNVFGAARVSPVYTGSYITSAVYLGDGRILVGGTGFVASLAPGYVEEWSESTIGVVEYLAGDKPSSPSVVAAGTSTGEIVAIQFGNERKRIDYYTASGAPVEQVIPVSDDRGTWIVALDSSRNLYIYKIPLTYWAQIGPVVGDGVKASLSGVGISWFMPVEKYTSSSSYYDPARIIALVDQGSTLLNALRGNVSASLYYTDISDGRTKPVTTGTINGTTFIEERRLFVYLVNKQGLLVDSRELNGSTPFTIAGLPATEYTMYFFYIISYIDPDTGIVGYSWCYSNWTNITVSQGQTLSVSLNLTYTNNTLDECLSYYGIQDLPTASLTELLYIDATSSPDALDFIVRLFPVPEDQTLTLDPLVDLASPAVRPQGWPVDASIVMAVASGDGNRVFIYLLTRDMVPVRLPAFAGGGGTAGGFLEQIILNSGESVTAIQVSDDARRIYIGTSAGRIVKLSWTPSLGMYVVESSMQVAYAPVVGIAESSGYAIVVARDGSMQLIDLDRWVPLWRGAPPFYSMRLENTGITELVYADRNILIAVDSNGGIIDFRHNSLIYHPILVNPTIKIKKLNNQIEDLNLTNNTILVYVSVNGEYKAVSLEQPYTLYSLEKPVDIIVEIPGYGKAIFADIVPQFPYTIINQVIMLREVAVKAYVPTSIGDPRADPGYTLLAGPVANAIVALTQTGSNTPYGYAVVSDDITNTTNTNGETTLVVWDGIPYNVRVQAENFQQAQARLPSIDPVTINIEMNPILYNVRFQIVDGDALRHGTSTQISGALFIQYENGRSLNFTVPSGMLDLLLPKGNYTISGIADHFLPHSISTYIDKSTTVILPLEPERYNIAIAPYIDLSPLSSVRMPLYLSNITIKLVNPYSGDIITADSFSLIQLRYGTYIVFVNDPYAGTFNATLTISSDGIYNVTFKPEIATTSIKFYDAEYPNKKVIGLVNLTITYVYGGIWQASKSVSVEGDKATLELPLGHYVLYAKGLGYELSTKELLIKDDSSVDFILTPAYHDVNIKVVYSDPNGIASGPVPGARLTLTIISPNVGFNYSLVVSQDGIVQAQIREGVYNVTIESSYTKTETYTVTVLGGDITLKATPKYARITLQAIDNEAHIAIPNFIATITRIGPGEPNTIEVTALGDTVSIDLPLGHYRIEASIPGRYEPLPADITVNSNMSVEVSMQPVKVSLVAVATSANAFVSYNNVSFRLPVGLIPNVTVTIIPSDPILTIVGAESISAITDSNGTVVFTDIRPGTYNIIASHDGYNTYSVIVDVTYDGQVVTLQLTPKSSVWVFSIIDVDMKPGYGNLSEATLHILEYNSMPANILIDYTALTPIVLSNGVYKLEVEIPGYTSEPVTISVSSDGSAILEVKGIRYTINVNLTAIVNSTLVPVEFGYIIAKPINMNLKVDEFVFNVTNGSAVLELRPGSYNLTYSMNLNKDYTVQIDSINIDRPKSLQLTLRPDPIKVGINVTDKELGIPLDGALVIIQYNGPFGTYNTSILFKTGETQIVSILPGIIIVRVDYDMYYTFEKTLVLPTRLDIRMEPITTPVSIALVNQDGERLSGINVHAIMKSTTLPIEYETMTDTGLLVFTGVRVGTYRLEVTPLNTTLYVPVTTSIDVARDSVNPSIIIVDYNMFNVSIRLLDSELGTPVPLLYEITISRDGEASAAMGFPYTIQVPGEAFTLLPPGRYKLSISPIENDYYQYPTETRISVPEKTRITITMIPKKYNVEITIVDDRGKPVEEALVTISSDRGTIASGYTDILGKFSSQLRWGTYSISIAHPDYQSTTRVIKVPDSTSITVDLEPTLQHRIKRMAPMLLGVIGLAVLLGAAYMMRSRLVARLLEEEEYF